MSAVDLNLQLKFLNELEDALADALKRYSEETPEKVAELKYMKGEVDRARRIVSERMVEESVDRSPSRRSATEQVLQEAAYS
ncbi:hypothetical protein QGN29_02870 [Temperatibacter marinus]|uniref:Uncharacterized protein n=1 Tax=Temperatibacter marinus TaxID=1456591 RepID=A0AA52EJR9_9PROT|nr:hypothetical protein [Temperatibacter marinus]WND03311.1 hypothetical protein QGN29_02870 [Temperatibacter marinus]